MGIRIYSISGRYYGYPPCCIEAFNKEQHKVNRIKRKLSGTGYIPCDICNQKTEEELIKIIESNRIAPSKFPQLSDIATTTNYILLSEVFTHEEKQIIHERYNYIKKSSEINEVVLGEREEYPEIIYEV